VAEAQAIPKQEKNFFEWIQEWIISLPIDLKVLLEISGDSQVGIPARSLAVGTLAYVVYFADLIPDKIPVLGLIDDVIVIRLSLEVIRGLEPERMKYYEGKYPTTFARFAEAIEVLKSALGLIYDALMALVEKLKNRRFKGHTAEEAARSEEVREEMFDEAMEYVANLNLNPDVVHKVLLEAPSHQVINLLTSGLEEEDKREIREAEAAKRLEAPKAMFRKLLQGKTDEETDEGGQS
jgi:uncharacterized membrane protein YkvA (DUF1232 family)